MKYLISLFTTLVISSSANDIQDCFDSCQQIENNCRYDCLRFGHRANTDRAFCEFDCIGNSFPCYSACYDDSASTNTVSKSDDSKGLSLRGSPTLLRELANEVTNQDQDINLIQDDGQCKSIYSECSRNADCCGEMECIDFGANGFSISLCDVIREDISCRSKGSDCSRNGDCCGDMICRDFGDPFSILKHEYSRLLCD